MNKDKPSDWPITRLSEAEASSAIRELYGSNRNLSEAEICKACGVGLERKETQMYNDGWRGSITGNRKIR